MASFGIKEDGIVQICEMIQKALNGIDMTENVKQFTKLFVS
jgi:hypothetical protein